MQSEVRYSSNISGVYPVNVDTQLALFCFHGISAGFPSPALDFADLTIDLNQHIIKHPSSTFFGRVQGDSLKNAGIDDGDLLVIDRSLEAKDGNIVVCFIDGEFTAKRIEIHQDEILLIPENEKYKPIKVNKNNNFLVWGVVTHTIKSF